MTLVALIRHGPTAWNEAGRIQGRTDIPLSEAGGAVVRQWRLPPQLENFAWTTSPLARARQTAALLDATTHTVEPALTEMHWGRWEGRTLAGLRRRHGAAFTANEARGLDFRPPGGESPRDVQERVRRWLAAVAADGRSVTAVTHKGVIRAIYALASDWPMIGKAPHRLLDGHAHVFALASEGGPRVQRMNIPLDGQQ